MPEKSRWARLPFWARMTIGAASILVPLLGAGIAAAILVQDHAVTTPDRPTALASTSAVPGPPDGPSGGVPGATTGIGTHQPRTVAPKVRYEPGPADQRAVTPAGDETDDSTPKPHRTSPAGADPSPARSTVPAAGGGDTGGPSSGGPTGTPVVTRRQITETREIPYRTRVVRDRSLAPGEMRLRTQGENGIWTLRYEVTTVDGTQTGKKLVDATVTKRPVTRIIAVGGRKPGDAGCVPNGDGYGCA